jgi:deoxyribodipyrimidine photolyase-related protein
MKTIRVVLGDQLSHSISSLQDYNPEQDIVLICEVLSEARYVKHHKKKIAFVFSAMRHFALELEDMGKRVDYIRLDDADNTGSLKGEVERAIQRHEVKKIIVSFPGEYRVLEDIRTWQRIVSVDAVEIREDTRFLCSPADFREWAKGRKQLRMEYFYRDMRKRYDILMNGDAPEGGSWNYDAENRKPPTHALEVPATYRAKRDAITEEVLTLVGKRFADHFGDLEPFYLGVTRAQAKRALAKFVAERLLHFGDYQDAMLEDEAWMYHSHLSFYLNCGLLQSLECIEAAEQAYQVGAAPLNAVEGFIRQLLGWREYVRGIYWQEMPGYARQNYLGAKRDLPGFFWSGKTKMNCVQQCVKETRENAYAHHIQRLMVLGNFSLLAGIHPQQVNEWYLIVYADAYEWVELPNVSGMILFADGGLLASKPYAASGSYINKMSNYCSNCAYKVSKKNGVDACPFNYLYWDFLARNRSKLEGNPRVSMMYKTWDRMTEDRKIEIVADSERFLTSL